MELGTAHNKRAAGCGPSALRLVNWGETTMPPLLPLMLSMSAARRLAMLCFLGALAVAKPIQAQTEHSHTRLVLGGGFSFAGGDPVTRGGPGLAGHLGLQHQRGSLLFSLRVGTNYGGIAPLRVPFGALPDRFDEFALTAGHAVHRSENSQVVLLAGVASVSGERVGTGPFGLTNVPFKTTIGVPIQMTVSAPRDSGFGLAAHINLSPEQVFGTVTVIYLIASGRRS
jgi:hypothetical protein